MAFEFSWDRRPNEEKVTGRLDFGELTNFQSVVLPLITDNAPRLAPLLPHLPRLTLVEIQGSLPKNLDGPKNLTLKLTDDAGKDYALTIGVGPNRQPMDLSLTLSEIDIPLGPILDQVPDPYSTLFESGSCVLHTFKASGPIGEWKSWNLSIKTTLAFEQVTIPEGRGSMGDAKLTLDGQVVWPFFKGKTSLQIGSAETPKLPKPVRGIQVGDSVVSVNLANRDIELSGDWSVTEAPGGSFSGEYSFSTANGYRIRGKNHRIDTAGVGIDLKGVWSGSFDAIADSTSLDSPSVSLALRGQNFRYGRYDFSEHPVELEIKGRQLPDRKFFLDRALALWGPNLQLTMWNTELSPSILDAERVEVGGDLNRLMRLLPPGRASDGWRNWVRPKGWKLRGGIRLGLKPDLSVETRNTQLDLGNGQRASFSFGYVGQTGQWDLKTLPVIFNLGPLLKNLGVSRVEANGQLKVQAEVSGNAHADGGMQKSLSALIKGEVNQANGRFRGKDAPGKRGENLLGWTQLNGPFSLSLNPGTKDIKTNFRFQDLGWFAPGSSNYSPMGGSHVDVWVAENNSGKYIINSLGLTVGKYDPIRIDLSGILERGEKQWLPQLNVRVEVKNSPKIKVSPSMEIDGSAEFEATVRPIRSGNWILDGKFDGRGFNLRVPSRPLILENLVGVIPIENVRLDEYFFKDRWTWRDHPFPSEPLGPDVVDQAFSLAGSVAPNARMDRVLVDDDDYRNLVGRMVMIDDIFYINSFTGLLKEGEFPLKGTGYLFIRPGKGSGMRIRGYSSKVPLGVAVPGLGNLGVEHDAVKIDWYNYQEPGELKIETRHIFFDIPVGKVMKKIPLLGSTLFGWTPDSLEAYELTLQRKKGGKYRVLKKGDTGDIPEFPQFVMTTESFEAPPPESDGGLWDGIKRTTRKVLRVGE